MKGRSYGMALGLVVVLTASGAAIHGRLSNRWGQPEEMQAAGARLQQIPEQFGPWRLTASNDLPESARVMLESAGDISRDYRDETSGAAAGVTVIVGPAGPIAVHSPEICFPGRDFQLVNERKRVKLRDHSGVEHELWMVDFRSRDLQARIVHVYYGWSIGGAWSAPDSARFAFAGQPYLYKLQVVGYPPPTALRESEDPVPAFLADFLPAARSHLVSPVPTP